MDKIRQVWDKCWVSSASPSWDITIVDFTIRSIELAERQYGLRTEEEPVYILGDRSNCKRWDQLFETKQEAKQSLIDYITWL